MNCPSEGNHPHANCHARRRPGPAQPADPERRCRRLRRPVRARCGDRVVLRGAAGHARPPGGPGGDPRVLAPSDGVAAATGGLRGGEALPDPGSGGGDHRDACEGDRHHDGPVVHHDVRPDHPDPGRPYRALPRLRRSPDPGGRGSRNRIVKADVSPGRRVVRRVEAGAGEPAVVLEAGLNNGAASWQRVMPLLAPHLRVAAYDRAGLGGSDPAPGLATIDRQIDDLASVITGLTAGPCVLAGHSWGGILVQLLAFRRPDLAAGLVLVDPGHEEMESELPLPVQWGWRIMRAVFPDELHEDAPVTL